jgi:hypothetical protein
MIRWTDMVDPVYTLCQVAGVDPDENEITFIATTLLSGTLTRKAHAGTFQRGTNCSIM